MSITQKISTKELHSILKYAHTSLQDLGPMTNLVAGILMGSDLTKTESIVRKMIELKQLSKNIQLNTDKEMIMHSTHTLRKFTTENDDMMDLIRVKLESEADMKENVSPYLNFTLTLPSCFYKLMCFIV